MKLRKILIILGLCMPFFLFAQQNGLYRSYIAKYKDVAIEQMNKHKIPASITLAQGLLESGAGQSKLAKEANNHFGIKCGSNWTGKYMRHNDDRRGEKFRAYDSPLESYEDHSLFLTTRAHYAPLFSLKITDYKGWAHGLKKAGYATNPKYASLLIKIIEEYDLQQYDKVGKCYSENVTQIPATKVVSPASYAEESDLAVRMRNKNYYVIARTGDTFKLIAQRTGVSERKLRKYNEVDKRYVLSAGDIVYLEKKQSKAEKKWKGKYHILLPGQSVYTVAQIYGVKLKTIYKLNNLPENYSAEAGDKLRIR